MTVRNERGVVVVVVAAAAAAALASSFILPERDCLHRFMKNTDGGDLANQYANKKQIMCSTTSRRRRLFVVFVRRGGR